MYCKMQQQCVLPNRQSQAMVRGQTQKNHTYKGSSLTSRYHFSPSFFAFTSRHQVISTKNIVYICQLYVYFLTQCALVFGYCTQIALKSQIQTHLLTSFKVMSFNFDNCHLLRTEWWCSLLNLQAWQEGGNMQRRR